MRRLNLRQEFRITFVIAGLLALVGGPLPEAGAERPSAPKLLPESTVAYIRVDNSRELVDLMRSSNLGRALQDEQIRPLVGALYGSVSDAFKQVEEQVGSSLDELLSIPQGEVCVAVVAHKTRSLAVVALLDVGQDPVVAEKLIARGKQALLDNSWSESSDTTGATKLTILKRIGDRDRKIVYFVKDGTLVLTSDQDLAGELLAGWSGAAEETSTLAENRKFTSLMQRCAGSKGERPQVSWFVDPIEIAKNAARGSIQGQVAGGVIDRLGIDGLKAIGGSAILSSEEFDTIVHHQILLGNPRSGVIEMLALAPDDLTPEPWVASDVSSYMSLHWDVETTYRTLRKVYDKLSGDGAFDTWIDENASQEIGIDLEKQLIAELDGRITMITWNEPPARLNSQTTLVGVKLKDARRFEDTLKQVLKKHPEATSKQSFAGVTYYEAKDAGNENVDKATLRVPHPCVAIVGDYLIATDSLKLLERAITTQRDGAKTLADELDFKLVLSKIGRQPGGEKPCMISFQRPEEAMRMYYELVQSDTVRGRLTSAGEGNPFFKSVSEALNKHPLPPFSVVTQYLAPGGGVLTDDESGFHYTTFSLRRKKVAEAALSKADSN